MTVNEFTKLLEAIEKYITGRNTKKGFIEDLARIGITADSIVPIIKAAASAELAEVKALPAAGSLVRSSVDYHPGLVGSAQMFHFSMEKNCFQKHLDKESRLGIKNQDQGTPWVAIHTSGYCPECGEKIFKGQYTVRRTFNPESRTA